MWEVSGKCVEDAGREISEEYCVFRPAFDEFFIVANSYRYLHMESRNVYFAVVDYEEAPNVFQQVGISK